MLRMDWLSYKNISLFLVTFVLSAQALSDSDEVMVVTASASAINLRQAPASITIITAEQLHRKPSQNLKEVLRDVPGVQLTNEGDNRKGVSLRGLPSGYTLILIDGKRVNSREALFRHNDFDLSWIPIDAIERIEVVRGPMSSLYGSDALGGVINIITRKSSAVWHGTVSADTTIQQQRDRGDSYNSNFFVSGPLIQDRLNVKFYGDLGKHNKDKLLSTLSPRIEGYTARDINLAFAVTPDENQKITLDYGVNRQDRDSDSLNNSRLTRQNYALAHEKSTPWGKTELRYYGDSIENFTEKGNITSWNNTLDGKLTLAVADTNQLITMGGEVRHNKLVDPVNLKTSNSTSASQTALFVEDEWRIIDPLALTTGLRMDYHQIYGDHWNPRAYLVYDLSDTVVIKGGWANAFKAPTLLQLNPDWTSPSCRGSCVIIGNKALNPETSQSIEFGLNYTGDEGITEGVTGSVMLFHNEMKNMISALRTPSTSLAPSYSNFVGFDESGRPMFRYVNINKARIIGLETELTLPFTPELSMTLNYTYTDGRDLSRGRNKPLLESPFHTANGNLSWAPSADWSYYVQFNYVGTRRTVTKYGQTPGGYTLWNAGLSKKMNQSFELRLGILNLFAKDLLRESYGFNEDGRRYFAALDYKF